MRLRVRAGENVQSLYPFLRVKEITAIRFGEYRANVKDKFALTNFDNEQH